ncbi:MAG TPA: hypothetical protein ENJ95_22120 [Bacteroidetes bacterium]|nr:hypothetical protein [Bacteroidota bacterium]
MALFGFFKTEKPVRFTYHPRFYDEKKESGLQKRLKEAREPRGGDPEGMKSRIRRDLGRKSSYFKDQQYRRKRIARSNLMLVLIIAALIVGTYVVLELYLPLIIEYFQ